MHAPHPHGPGRRTRPATLAPALSLVLLLGGCAQIDKAATPASAASPDVRGKTAAPGVSAPAKQATPPASTSPTGTPATGTPATATPPAAPATAAVNPATAPAAPPSFTPPGTPPPFATVIRDARRIDGPITAWQKDDKVWLELLPSQIGKPFFFSPKIKNGISDAWILGGLMNWGINGAGGPQVVEFQRVHNTVRFVARNTDVVATAGSPEARALKEAYSDSLLGATPVASAPHPDRRSILIEANGLFLSDILGIGMMLQRGLRQGYGLDRSNSVVTAVRATEQALVLETQNHFFNASPSASPPFLFPGAAQMPAPMLPRFLPDTRSMLVGLHFSLAPLPEQPMTRRRADPRLGHFTSATLDFASDLPLSPKQRVVQRWRLEKKDPGLELSEPVKPIVFWIDRNVPHAYRETVRAGILEWNKAFEKIGFRNAIVVQQQAEDATWDTLDFGVASVRWMLNADPQFSAIGPSHVDPRSGEILDADIAIEGMAVRAMRGIRSQVLGAQRLPDVPGGSGGAGQGGSTATPAVGSGPAPADFAPRFVIPGLEGLAVAEGRLPWHDMRYCNHAHFAAEQGQYAMAVLEARGELDPDSPIAQQFVLDFIKDNTMHEVGHALGLRHNFRASRVYSEAQLADAEFTRAHGTTGSVMEYNPINLARPGVRGGVPFQSTLGPYDYWAIEYAYKPMPTGTLPAAEEAELQRIAGRSADPLLAFGTDEDSFVGLDPETLPTDLGADPIAFASKRLAIAQDLFKRQETRALAPDRDYAVLRRSLGFALSDVARAVGVLARQLGGVRTLRDYPGSGRDPLQPVPAALQREALTLILSHTLSPDGLALSPGLQRRLAPDYLDRADAWGLPTEFQVPQRLLELQRAVLAYLMSDLLAGRVLDNLGKLDKPGDGLPLAELHRQLTRSVWREIESERAAVPISAARRELQREHVNRLAFMVLRPTPGGRTDTRNQVRETASRLLERLERMARRSGLDSDSQSHLADSADTLRQAIRAPLLRQGL